VAGCGQIGSHLIPHLVRLAELNRLILIDLDVYESANLVSQAIDRSAIGRPKAEVQAERARAIRPDLEVVALHAAVESVPLSTFAGAVVVGCLDGPAARRTLGERAWRLGCLYIDTGVKGDDLLVRVSVLRPGADLACGECSWPPSTYETLAQTYPCGERTGNAASVAAPPTGAWSSLGGLAGSLGAIEVTKHVIGDEFTALVIAVSQRHGSSDFSKRIDDSVRSPNF